LTTEPIVPDHIRAAIHAGHVGQVVIFCDECGTEECADYTGETREVRFAVARRHLAESKGWAIADAYDLCPRCAVELSNDDDSGGR
jgi:hypothetical protein